MLDEDSVAMEAEITGKKRKNYKNEGKVKRQKIKTISKTKFGSDEFDSVRFLAEATKLLHSENTVGSGECIRLYFSLWSISHMHS